MSEILVLNAGSSSVRAARFEIPSLIQLESIQIHGIGSDRCRVEGNSQPSRRIEATDHRQAFEAIVSQIRTQLPNWEPMAVGHRVVHGGSRFDAAVKISPEIRTELESLIPLAPLHEPSSLIGIDLATSHFPNAVQVGCFDTTFHRHRGFVSETYALPREFYDRGILRYGFHGLSYESIMEQLGATDPAAAAGRVVAAHLGNGSSVCAIRNGKSIQTSMGFTALDGLPMGTRCGQIDPGVILYLMQYQSMSIQEIERLFYHQSGLLGLSGISSDMRELLASEENHAQAAINYFVDHVAMMIASYIPLLGGVDAIVFSGGIGENASTIRERIVLKLGFLGPIDLFHESISPSDSLKGNRIRCHVIRTSEETIIARKSYSLITKGSQNK